MIAWRNGGADVRSEKNKGPRNGCLDIIRRRLSGATAYGAVLI